MDSDYRKVYGRVESKSRSRRNISPIRFRMYEDMRLAGLAEKTQECYVYAVSKLQRDLNRNPAKLSERELRNYFVWLRDERKVAKGTFQGLYYGLKFFYCNTLNRDWSLFTKKKYVYLSRSVFRLRLLMKSAAG